MATKNINPTTVNVVYTLFILFIVVVMAGLLYVFNRGLFDAPKTPSTVVTEQLKLPLSRITADIKLSAAKELCDSSDWIKLSSGWLSSSVTLSPKNAESMNKFINTANSKDYAVKLDKLYNKDGYVWDAKKNELILPILSTKNAETGESVDYIPFPTWILYELIPAE